MTEHYTRPVCIGISFNTNQLLIELFWHVYDAWLEYTSVCMVCLNYAESINFFLQNKFHTYSLMFSQFHWFYAKTVSVYRDKIFIYFERILVEYERNNYSLSLQGRTYTNWSTFWFHFVFSSIFFFVSFLVCVYTNLLIFFWFVCLYHERKKHFKKKCWLCYL